MLEGPPAGRGRGLEEGDYQEVGVRRKGEVRVSTMCWGERERFMRCQCPARPQCSQQQQSIPHYNTSNT